MAITFNEITAEMTTFGELIEVPEGAEWVRLWTGESEELATGSYVDTGEFGVRGYAGWVKVEDLENLKFDFAQANDKLIYAQTWSEADGPGDWVKGEVDFSVATENFRTETITEDTPLNEMFTAENTDDEAYFNVFIGKKEDDEWVGRWITESEYGQGWISKDQLKDFNFTVEDAENDYSLYVQTWSKGYTYGWENWEVEADVTPTYTLAEAVVLKLAEELPEVYNIDTEEKFVADDITVETAGESYPLVVEILEDAQNADELDIEELFEWSIADTAANIIAAAEEVTVTGAESVGLAEDEVASVEQATALLDLENFDGEYDLMDSFETLWENVEEEVVENANSYSLSDEEGTNFGTLSQDQVNFIREAENYEDDKWTWGVQGNEITLTTDNDVVGPEAEEGFQTTADDDTIIGVVSNQLAERTLNAGDQIDGGEGEDTLSLTVKGDFTGFTGDGFLKNVQTVELENTSAIARSFSAKGTEDIETFVITAGKGMNLKGLSETGLTVKLEQASGAFKAEFASKVTDGTDDKMGLVLNGVGTAKTTTAAAEYVDITMAGIEELDVKSLGDGNYVDLSGVDAAETIVVSGAGNLDINEVGTAVKNFDASDATGDVTADLSDSNAAIATLKGGAGDDTLTIKNLATTAVVDGGEGYDTLVFDEISGTLQPTISNFQHLYFDGLGGKFTLAGKNVEGVEKITADEIGTNNLLLAQMTTEDLELVLLDEGTSSDAGNVTYDGLGTLGISAEAAADTVKDKDQDVINFGVTASKVTSLTMDVGQFVKYSGDISAAKAEAFTLNVASGMDGTNQMTEFNGKATVNSALELTVNSEGTLGGSAAIIANKAVSANITANGDDTLDLSASELLELNLTNTEDFSLITTGNLDKVTNLTVETSGVFDSSAAFKALETGTFSGAGSVDLTKGAAIAEDSGALNLDASGLLGDFTVEVADWDGDSTASVVVIGTDFGVNSITVGNGRKVEATGGVQADTFNIQAGNGSVLTGGDGNDNFQFTAINTDLNQVASLDTALIDTITDLNSGDTIAVDGTVALGSGDAHETGWFDDGTVFAQVGENGRVLGFFDASDGDKDAVTFTNLEEALKFLDAIANEDEGLIFAHEGSTYLFVADGTQGNLFDDSLTADQSEDFFVELQGISSAEEAATIVFG
ncbi:hypothetical protein [Desulfonatronovibrio magnus]|uniref:hypothetical protein n=1 Tax=Desulfonatronovibrio magnus TaxID=698827 RepID=UPI0005EBB963|nr:hypothetical protein [Desulfonatronovibrio magnus]